MFEIKAFIAEKMNLFNYVLCHTLGRFLTLIYSYSSFKFAKSNFGFSRCIPLPQPTDSQNQVQSMEIWPRIAL